MRWMPLHPASYDAVGADVALSKEDVHALAIDLAKRSFQVCTTDRGGAVLFNRTLSRANLMQILDTQEPRIVAMEACAKPLLGSRRAGQWPRCPAGPNHLCEAVRQAAEERRSRRRRDRRSRAASEHALRCGEEGRDVPNPPLLRAPAHAADRALNFSVGFSVS